MAATTRPLALTNSKIPNKSTPPHREKVKQWGEKWNSGLDHFSRSERSLWGILLVAGWGSLNATAFRLPESLARTAERRRDDFWGDFSSWFAGWGREAPQLALERGWRRERRVENGDFGWKRKWLRHEPVGSMRWRLDSEVKCRLQPEGRPTTTGGHQRCSQFCHHVIQAGATSTRATSRRAWLTSTAGSRTICRRSVATVQL